MSKSLFDQRIEATRTTLQKLCKGSRAAGQLIHEVANYTGKTIPTIHDWLNNRTLPNLLTTLLVEEVIRRYSGEKKEPVDFLESIEMAICRKVTNIEEIAQVYGAKRADTVLRWIVGESKPLEPLGVLAVIRLLRQRNVLAKNFFQPLSEEVKRIAQGLVAGSFSSEQVIQILDISLEDLKSLLRGTAEATPDLRERIQKFLVPMVGAIEEISPTNPPISQQNGRDDTVAGQSPCPEKVESQFEHMLIDVLKLVRALGGDFLQYSTLDGREEFRKKAGPLVFEASNITAALCGERAFELHQRRGKC